MPVFDNYNQLYDHLNQAQQNAINQQQINAQYNYYQNQWYQVVWNNNLGRYEYVVVQQQPIQYKYYQWQQEPIKRTRKDIVRAMSKGQNITKEEIISLVESR